MLTRLIINNTNQQLPNDMSEKTLILLNNTLNPSLLNSTHQEIARNRSSKGFATDLMIIADDSNNNMSIRQSALIVLKNMIFDHANNVQNAINASDYEIVKGSIVDALARLWDNKSLVPTLRQIVYLIAEMDYPDRWPDVVPYLLTNISTSADFHAVASSVQCLKALTSACSRLLTQQVTLNNLCNKMVIPLLQLANKLFANYTPITQTILVSIFKIFNLAIFYHLPLVLINNIRSLMIFCKKIIDLQIPEMNPLKKICLKILSRLYSRHTGSNAGFKNIKFAQQFHKNYSVQMTQSFIMQLMDSNNINDPQILNLSLNCLTSVYKNHEQSSVLIDKYHQQILQYCIQRYKLKKTKTENQSVGSFITHIKEERCQFVEFIIVLFQSNQKILGDLIEYLNKGDQSTQQLVLYTFGALSQEVQNSPHLHQNMSEFIITYILPILSGHSSTIMKARGCQVISAYKYLQLPQQNLQQIFRFIYTCLTQSKDSYLNIYALQAFTQLICKYDKFMGLIIPYLHDILKVYTNLMKESNGEVYEVIKSFQLFLGQINGNDIKDCALDLVKFLSGLFYQYNQQKQNQVSKGNDEQQSDEDDEQVQDDPTNAKYGCLACIRQIIAIDNLPANILPQIISTCILPLAVLILSDKQLLHFQQCLNILNLCLYKSTSLPQNFQQFFKIFAYSILGVPNQLASINGLSEQYKQIIVNVCVDPDEDIVENVIGFFRNFIAKANNKLRDLKDQLNINFMEYLFLIVQTVQERQNNQNNGYRYKQSDRSLILTIYVSLLEFQFLQNPEKQRIITTLTTWYGHNQSSTESSVYIEMLLVCLYYNPELTANNLNIQWFMQQVFNCYPTFKYEYQLQRVVLGLGRAIQKQIGAQPDMQMIMKGLPDLVFKLISQRIKEQNQGNQNDQKKNQGEQIDAEEEAQEDLIGENTHLGTFPAQSEARQRQRQKQAELNAYEEAEWDEQYNKFYYSPLMGVNELEYLTNVLKHSPYTNMLSSDQQQKLTSYICNAPPKQPIN